MFKKNVLLFTVLIILFSSKAFASEEVERGNLFCLGSVNGNHACYLDRGYLVVDTSTNEALGHWEMYICKYCQMKVLTEGYPHLGGKIYRYVTDAQTGFQFSGQNGEPSGVIEIDCEFLDNCNNNKLPGFEFYYKVGAGV